MEGIKFGYDFWYQPRHNVMVSSEWAAPNTFMPGFDLEEVGHLKYGREIHFWDFEKREPKQTFYLGEARPGDHPAQHTWVCRGPRVG